jgi:CHAD domain-containing protein
MNRDTTMAETRASSSCAGDAAVGAVARRQLAIGLRQLRRRFERAATCPDEDPEHVHSLRVVTRRLREALRVYEPLLPADELQWLLAQLKRIRRAADAARDCDVIDERLASRGDRSSRAVRAVEKAERRRAQQPLEQLWRRKRRKLKKRARRLVDGVRFEGEGLQPYSRWLARAVRRQAADVTTMRPPRSDDLEALHRLRIATKKLRYALELVAAECGARSDEDLLAELAMLQALLGEVNDHVTARERMRRWSREAWAESGANEFGDAITREEEALVNASRAFASWWTPARRRELDERLGRQVEALARPGDPGAR